MDAPGQLAVAKTAYGWIIMWGAALARLVGGTSLDGEALNLAAGAEGWSSAGVAAARAGQKGDVVARRVGLWRARVHLALSTTRSACSADWAGEKPLRPAGLECDGRRAGVRWMLGRDAGSSSLESAMMPQSWRAGELESGGQHRHATRDKHAKHTALAQTRTNTHKQRTRLSAGSLVVPPTAKQLAPGVLSRGGLPGEQARSSTHPRNRALARAAWLVQRIGQRRRAMSCNAT